MANKKTYTWHPHKHQSRVLRSPHRFTMVSAGRRSGKSQVAAVKLLEWSKESNKQHPVWWAAPTYELAEPGYLACIEIYPPEWIDTASMSHQNMHISLRNGAYFEFKSAEKERSFRGRGIAGAVGEEMGEWKRRAWQEGLRPTLTDFEAPFLGIGTPKGMNLFWELCSRAQDEAKWPDHTYLHWTSYDNPHLSRAEIDSARRELPDRVFRQEYLAEFLQDAGGVFNSPHQCVKGDLEPPNSKDTYVAGWDVAKHDDWSVLTIDRVRDRHTVAWERVQKLPYPEQVRRVVKMCAEYHADILMDATGPGDPVFDFTVRAASEHDIRVWPYKFTAASKADLVNKLVVHVADRSTSWPDLPTLTNEMLVFEYQSGGRMNAPSGYHDDCVISKALAVWLADHHRPHDADLIDLSKYY